MSLGQSERRWLDDRERDASIDGSQNGNVKMFKSAHARMIDAALASCKCTSLAIRWLTKWLFCEFFCSHTHTQSDGRTSQFYQSHAMPPSSSIVAIDGMIDVRNVALALVKWYWATQPSIIAGPIGDWTVDCHSEHSAELYFIAFAQRCTDACNELIMFGLHDQADEFVWSIARNSFHCIPQMPSIFCSENSFTVAMGVLFAHARIAA